MMQRSKRLRSVVRGVAYGLSLGMLCSGCFTVEHQLPKGSYFGKLPTRSGERVQSFDEEAHKNWFLAGLFPYSSFSVEDLAPQDAPPARIQNLAVETRFSEFDVFISVIPGAFYGYYLWAPRTIRIQGQQVRTE